MAIRLPLSSQELKKYIEDHIQYEFDMLIWSTGILAHLQKQKNDALLTKVVHDAVLNTFSIHARNLILFLYPEQAKKLPTDVAIDDYVEKTTFHQCRPTISDRLTEAKKKADKQVAHLTTDRIEYEHKGKEWQFIAIASDIVGILSTMVSHVPQERISDQLRQKLSNAKLAIPAVSVRRIYSNDGVPIGASCTCE